MDERTWSGAWNRAWHRAWWVADVNVTSSFLSIIDTAASNETDATCFHVSSEMPLLLLVVEREDKTVFPPYIQS